MGNNTKVSESSFTTTNFADMKAFDRLPPAIRKVLREADGDYSAEEALSALADGTEEFTIITFILERTTR